MGSSDEFVVKEEEPESPQRANQELVEWVEEKTQVPTLRERLADPQTKLDAEWWCGYFDTPTNTEESQERAWILDQEAGTPNKSG